MTRARRQATKAARAETKAAGDPDLKDAFDDFLGAFEAFREANDERLDEIERKLSADVVTEEKVARINDALDGQKRMLDRLVLKGSRPELGSPGRARALEASEHKAAFDAYVRQRRDDRPEAARGEGGLHRHLARLAATWCRRRRRRRSAGGLRSSRRSARSPASARSRPTSIASPSPRPASRPAGWARPTRATETDTPTLVELEYPVMELYAMPAATQTLLDDTAIDIDQWIASEVEMAFAEQESARLRQRRRRQEAEGLSRLHDGRRGELGVGQARLRADRRLRPTSPPTGRLRRAGRRGLRAEGRLSAERPLG